MGRFRGRKFRADQFSPDSTCNVANYRTRFQVSAFPSESINSSPLFLCFPGQRSDALSRGDGRVHSIHPRPVEIYYPRKVTKMSGTLDGWAVINYTSPPHAPGFPDGKHWTILPSFHCLFSAENVAVLVLDDRSDWRINFLKWIRARV